MEDLTTHLSIAFPVDALSFGWAAGAALCVMAWQSARSTKFFVLSAMVINAVVGAMTLMLGSSPAAALQLIAVGLGLASYGFMASKRLALLFGVGFAGVGFIAEVAHAIEVFELSGWLALASFGSVLVALTAWLERRARSVRLADPAAKVSQEAPVVLP